MRPPTRKSGWPICELSSAPGRLRAILRKSLAFMQRAPVSNSNILHVRRSLRSSCVGVTFLRITRHDKVSAKRHEHKSHNRSQEVPDSTRDPCRGIAAWLALGQTLAAAALLAALGAVDRMASLRDRPVPRH